MRSFYPSDWHNNLVHTLVPAQFCLQCKLVSIAPSGHRHFAPKQRSNRFIMIRAAFVCLVRHCGFVPDSQTYIYIYTHTYLNVRCVHLCEPKIENCLSNIRIAVHRYFPNVDYAIIVMNTYNHTSTCTEYTRVEEFE